MLGYFIIRGRDTPAARRLYFCETVDFIQHRRSNISVALAHKDVRTCECSCLSPIVTVAFQTLSGVPLYRFLCALWLLLCSMQAEQNSSVSKMATGKLVDPVEYLGEDCSVHIFSFICGTPVGRERKSLRLALYAICGLAGDDKAAYLNWKSAAREKVSTVNVVEAAKLYVSLASVSRGWKKIMDENIAELTPNIQVKLDSRDLKVIKACIEWTIRHNLPLQAIECNIVGTAESADYFDAYPLFSRLVTLCDTSQLHCVWITVFLGKEDEMLQCRSLQDTIAKNCPNLRDLAVLFYNIRSGSERESFSKAISASLFSHNSVEDLILSFQSNCANGQIDDPFLATLHQDLPCLRVLSFFCNEEKWIPVINIRSMSLRVLNTFNFTRNASFSAAACPSLELFTCWSSPIENEAEFIELAPSIDPESLSAPCFVLVHSEKDEHRLISSDSLAIFADRPAILAEGDVIFVDEADDADE